MLSHHFVTKVSADGGTTLVLSPQRGRPKTSADANSNCQRKVAGLKKKSIRPPKGRDQHELVIISGMSGAGKASALKTFEDLGYYCVDNLPVGLISNFAELVLDSLEIQRAALVVDIREGARLDKLPQILASLRRMLKTTVVFLEADTDVLVRRYSETRRPHPLGRDISVRSSLTSERRRLQPLRELADVVVDTHEVQRPRVALVAHRTLSGRQSRQEHPDFLRELWLPRRRAGRRRPGVRRALPAQSAFHSQVPSR